MAAALAILREEVRKKDDLIVQKDEVIERLDEQLKRQQSTIERMQAQMEDLLRRMYGRRSEKLDINQLLMDGVILEADSEEHPPAAPLDPEKPVESRARRKTNGRRPLPDHFPRHEIIIPVSEEEKICPVTGNPRPLIGYEESQKLEYIPEMLRVNVYKREKYGSPMGAEETGVVTAPVPPAVIDRCLADTGLLAHVAVAKFDDHLPLYRQERMFLRQGVQISRKTMAGWLGQLALGLYPLWSLLESREFRPQSPMYKAMHYVLNNRERLTEFTTDERLPIDNNPVERALRRVAIGRKNWLFLGSETGGQTAATRMSLLGTCWANKVNAWMYLKDVLDRLPTQPDHQIEELLPHRWIQSNPEARLPDPSWTGEPANVVG